MIKKEIIKLLKKGAEIKCSTGFCDSYEIKGEQITRRQILAVSDFIKYFEMKEPFFGRFTIKRFNLSFIKKQNSQIIYYLKANSLDWILNKDYK